MQADWRHPVRYGWSCEISGLHRLQNTAPVLKHPEPSRYLRIKSRHQDHNGAKAVKSLHRPVQYSCKAKGNLLPWHAFRGTQANKDRKSTRLNSSHVKISYAVFCLKK